MINLMLDTAAHKKVRISCKYSSNAQEAVLTFGFFFSFWQLGRRSCHLNYLKFMYTLKIIRGLRNFQPFFCFPLQILILNLTESQN